MSFLEVKGALAKLLATENLHVQHDGTAQTASFNTATRVLTLPVLQTDNSHVYDMFVGHEVGHALYTPCDWIEQAPDEVPFDFINVIEDVRIERMIQDKFPGLRKDFTRGYDYLNEQNFFEIVGKDLAELSFVDRINLHFKLGNRALIPFTEEEMTYVRAVDEADTFEKVCLVSKMIADYLNTKSDPTQEQPSESLNGDNGQDGESESTSQAKKQAMESLANDEDQEDGPGDIGDHESGPQGGTSGSQNQSETQRALDKNLERLCDPTNGKKVTYLKAPIVDLAKNITPIEFLREDYETLLNQKPSSVRYRVDELYSTFMASIKRDVNFMVQQFEMRKSADAYSRQQIHKTGVLDTEKLHLYKLTDDVFMRQTVTPDGKSHGMVMLIDWSGSMQDKVIPTTKQLLVLTQFCRKVGISFDVYTFTCNGYGYPSDYVEITELDQYDMTVATLGPKLVHVLSSQTNRRQLDQDMKNLFANAFGIGGSMYYGIPVSSYLHMGGTPLNNTLFLYPALVERLQSHSHCQKVSTVTLTDGESTPLYYFQKRSYDSDYITLNMVNPYDTLLLKDGHNVYNIKDNTGSIVEYLQKKMPGVSFTHIFLGGPSACEKYARQVSLWKQDLDVPLFRKQGSATLSDCAGWPLVALVNPNTFTDPQDELNVEAGASKAQIRSALRKMLKTKSSSKLLLTHLVEQFS